MEFRLKLCPGQGGKIMVVRQTGAFDIKSLKDNYLKMVKHYRTHDPQHVARELAIGTIFDNRAYFLDLTDNGLLEIIKVDGHTLKALYYHSVAQRKHADRMLGSFILKRQKQPVIK